MQLIILSDLENDFINPHDSSASLNTWVVCAAPLSYMLSAPRNIRVAPRMRFVKLILEVTHAVVQMPEYIAQAALTALLLFTGKWLSGLVMLVLVAWNVRTYLRDEHKVDVTEVFRQIPREKNIRIVKLIFYLVGFVYFIYR